VTEDISIYVFVQNNVYLKQ